MKNLAKQFLFLLGVTSLLSFGACSSTKKTTAASPASTQPAALSNSASSYLGTWSFLVTGTPDGDTKGDMIISQNGNVLKGMISSGVGQSEIKDLKIVNNILTGVFDYNGMSINMAGTFNGNNFEGKVEAQGYSFPMTATKKM